MEELAMSNLHHVLHMYMLNVRKNYLIIYEASSVRSYHIVVICKMSYA